MTQNPPSSRVVRLPNGQFAPGSGGRPPGSKNRVSKEAMAAVKDLSSAALQQLSNGVHSGERWAVEYVLNKILPVGRIVQSDAQTMQELLHEFQDGNFSVEEVSKLATVFKDINDDEVEEMRKKFDAILKQIELSNEQN